MTIKKWVKVIILCFAWYTSSSLNNIVGKHVLNTFPHPMTLTLVQLMSITLYSIPLLRGIDKPVGKCSIKTPTYVKFIVPLAIGKFLASVSSHWSIWKVPVSYAHTVKATMPLFTVILSRLIYNETHSKRTYASLVPIILGVGIASATELNFNLSGLISALISTLAFSLQNIFSKQVLKTTKLHQFELLYILARLSLLFYLPLWILLDFNLHRADPNTLFLLGVDGLLSFLQNILAFSFLNLVTPLTYSVANASKRIFIICASIIIFRNQVGVLNVLGIMMAIFGVFLYNTAKLKGGKKDMEKPLLPLNNNYV